MLEVESLTKYYDSKEIGPFNLSFNSDLLVAIIGKSGSGKSTLIKMITNIIKSDQGSVSYNNTFLKKEDYTYISQIGTLFSHLTIRENISLTNKVEDIKIVKIMERLNLSKEYLDKYPFELSGGERQRIDLVRALLSKSKFIVLDESMSALDSDNKKSISSLLKQFVITGEITILYITHDVAQAIEYSTRIINIADGDVTFNGDTSKYEMMKAGE